VPTNDSLDSALSLESLRTKPAASSPAAEPGKTWAWALKSGNVPEPPLSLSEDCSPSELLLTGHNNGSVTFWDMAYETPQRLCHYSNRNGRPVSALVVDTAAGLLAVGHRGGEVSLGFCV
jgi:hypothetical protein